MRKLLATSLVLIVSASLCTSLVAQKMPDPQDNRRVVQMHDVSQWLSLMTEGMKPHQRAKAQAEAVAGLASFARSFIEPPLEPGADIVAMSQRYLVAIAEPQQQAWIERLMAKQMGTELYQVHLQLQQFSMNKARFEALVAPALAKPDVPATASAPAHTVLLGKRGEQLAAAFAKHADIKLLNAPQVVGTAMATRKIRSGRDLPYVKDFEVEIGNADFVATPIHESIFDGLNAKASSGLLADGRLGVALDLAFLVVEQPFAEFETTLGVNHKVTIQLPNSRAVHWRRALALPKGGTALCCFARGEEHMVFLLSADKLP